MVFPAKFLMDQDIYCANKAQNRALALDLTEVSIIQSVREGKIECLEEAHDEVRVG